MKKYKAVLFDYDGTIVDSNQVVTDSWQCMAEKFVGHELPKDILLKTFGLPLIEGFKLVAKQYGLPTDEESLKAMDSVYTNYQYEHTLDGYPTFPGMIELIKKLAKTDIKLGVVTSRRQKSLYEGLERYGIKECFDAVVCHESTEIHKPFAEPALCCCRQMNIDPKDAIMIGDSKFDIACGNNAGCDTCFVLWSFSNTKKDIDEYSPATCCAASADEFYKLITEA